MSADEILTRLDAMDGFRDLCEVDQGKVVYMDTFQCFGEEEPHDRAWEIHSDYQEQLGELGLAIVEMWSDNDSVGGTIVEKPCG